MSDQHITFEEYRAVQKRKRAQRKGQVDSLKSPHSVRSDSLGGSPASEGPGEVNLPSHWKAGLNTVATTLERTDIQICILGLIFIDLVASSCRILLMSDVVEKSYWTEVCRQLLNQILGFTIVLFVVEILLLAIAYHRAFFTHPGYLLDIGIVVASVVFEAQSSIQALRLLGFLRVWRLLRLINTWKSAYEARIEVLADKIEEHKQKTKRVRAKLDQAAEEINAEVEARTNVEQMLQSYKDEVTTLQEALNIAAMAMAKAKHSQIGPDGSEGENWFMDDEGIGASVEPDVPLGLRVDGVTQKIEIGEDGSVRAAAH